MKTKLKKIDLPPDKIRKYLEPAPVVLVSSRWKGQNNTMSMGWYTVMEFSPALIGCVNKITAESYYSHTLA
jgi:flavin reductase (DIM6/NTAB) family NADH-FMN oxidoreductase RutF